MIELGKGLERYQDEAVTARAALVSTKDKVHRLASEIDGVRERSEGAKIDRRTSADRAEDAVGRNRAKAKRVHDILEETEGKSYGLVGKLE